MTLMVTTAIHLFCDCQSAIDSLTTSKTQTRYQQIIHSTQALIRQLKLNSAPVHLHWTPGCIDLDENELAEVEAAKEATTEAKGLPTDSSKLIIRDAKSTIRKALTA